MELSPEEERKIYEEKKASLEMPRKPKKKETQSEIKGLLVLIVILFIGALAWGAISQMRLSNSEANLSTTKADLSKTYADLVSAQANLTSTQTDLTNSQSALLITTNALSDVQTKLTDMQSKFPPHEFASLTDLQNWFHAHNKPSIPGSLNQAYLDALKIQNEASQDGYVVGIEAACYSYGGAPGYAGVIGWVVNTATVNGTLYLLFTDAGGPNVCSANEFYGVSYFQNSTTCPPDYTYTLPLPILLEIP